MPRATTDLLGKALSALCLNFPRSQLSGEPQGFCAPELTPTTSVGVKTPNTETLGCCCDRPPRHHWQGSHHGDFPAQ